jgi:hypothetical protein
MINRMGTIDFGVSETTPLVYKDRLYRFEYINRYYHKARVPDSYFHFVDVATGECSEPFGLDYHFGSAHVQDDTVYVYGLPGSRRAEQIHVFWSNDMKHWSCETALHMPGWELLNNSVCRGRDEYVMCFEVGAPGEVVGVQFTNFFASSSDLVHWDFLGEDVAFDKTRYTACPTLRYHNGWYYQFYLERATDISKLADPDNHDTVLFDTNLARSRDLRQWHDSPFNPFLGVDEGDRTVLNPDINVEQQQRMAAAPMMNLSDMDLCEFEGKVVIYYSWGTQRGIEYLAEARYDGTMGQMLEGFFPS